MSAILAGEISDETGLRLSFYGAMLSYNGGIILLWIAAVLTVITGIDYLRKAMPFLTEDA